MSEKGQVSGRSMPKQLDKSPKAQQKPGATEARPHAMSWAAKK